MPLQKQSIKINFQEGLDTKTDPFQIMIGKFTSLVNSVFDTLKRLTKRNGFPLIQQLPDSTSTSLTTYNGNLLAIGSDLKALAQGPQSWNKVASFYPVSLSTQALVRNSNNQSQIDTAISANGLVCAAYTEQVASASTTINQYKIAVYDYTTGQAFIQPTVITPSTGTVQFAPKVFNLSPQFMVVFDGTSGSTSHLQYVSVSQTAFTIGSATDIATTYNPQAGGSFDGVVANNYLYLSWNASSDAGIKSTYIDRYLTQGNSPVIASSTQVQSVSVCADNSGASPIIWTNFSVGSTSVVTYTVATDTVLNTQFSARPVGSGNFVNLASFAQGGKCTLFLENSNTYSYDGALKSNFITFRQITSTGSAGASQSLIRSLGLASKAFQIGSVGYVMGAYSSSLQPTYFLVNSSASIVAKLAYSNGGGYAATGLPSVSISSSTAYVGYLFKDLVASANKNTAVGSTTQTAQIYSQTGANLAAITFGTSNLVTSEMAGSLNINGGLLSMYDGSQLVENNFHLFPDNVEVTGSSNSGSLSTQTYFYQNTYEWTDNKGNNHRSAPSVPVSVVISSGTSAVTVNFPTLRVTAKTNGSIKNVIYRWSANQQSYYQVTSLTAPILNDSTVDSLSYTDKSSDASILGNNLLYTTGNVVEDIGPPACTAISQFDSRLWLIDAEDQNLLWYSKQVIEGTPIEMSDLFTFFVSPNAGAQGNTGPMKCIFPMDDKLIIFKKNAIYYINGVGPDITGSNNQYSQPIFISGTIGCVNQNSIVLMQHGLMFQSDKGIWLLGRDLSTQYIGKDVEAFNQYTVLSSLVIPGTNQVRFTLSNGITLFYDYFVGQWGIFKGISAISSTLYQNVHTYINKFGQAFQESPGTYLDGTTPTVMSFTTGWINLGDLQSYGRAYKLFLLGQFQSPHILTIGVAYDYDPSITQQVTLNPTNYNQSWGGDTVWGGGSDQVWGGNSQQEQWQVNLQNQDCQSIQITFTEYYDPSKGPAAGAGLTLSGMNLVVGLKKAYPENLGVGQKKG